MVKINKLLNLDLDVSALYLIAAPKTPEPVRQEVTPRQPRMVVGIGTSAWGEGGLNLYQKPLCTRGPCTGKNRRFAEFFHL
jgi:hypothetical protein